MLNVGAYKDNIINFILPKASTICNNFRPESRNTQAKATADIPLRLGQYRHPLKQYTSFAKLSSERRRYIPFGFIKDSVIPVVKLFTIPNTALYGLGILTLNVCMAWMLVVCGRLKAI